MFSEEKEGFDSMGPRRGSEERILEMAVCGLGASPGCPGRFPNTGRGLNPQKARMTLYPKCFEKKALYFSPML